LMSEPRITIVGLGLLGSSMGLALREAQPDFRIVGHDKDSSLSKKAKGLGAIEEWERNLISAIEDAELVIITTDIADTRTILEAIGPYLRPDCVVTDTATVKGEIVRWADEFLPDSVHFVGGHPLVSQQNGDAVAARADLFQGATYCIVPSAKAHPAAIELVTSMVRTLGAEPFFLDLHEHDGQVAGVEHLPLMLSAALLLSTTQAPSWRDLMRLPGDVFWKATEPLSAAPEVSQSICLANRENISRWIDIYVDNLRELQEKLADADDETWEVLFHELLDTRARWMAGRGMPDEEATERSMEELRSMTSIGSMLGLNQFRDLRKKIDQQRREPE
jgi:prephenate dehydrogenase